MISRAKINVSLRVQGKRADGFHELETVFAEIDLADQITWVDDPEPFRLEVIGADLGNPEENLVSRTVRLFEKETGVTVHGRCRLHKHIPAGGGLGGGSSNAATVLRYLLSRFPGRCSRSRMFELAAQLGSDVPFFLIGGVCLGEGRGELLTPYHLPHDFPRAGVLLLPGIHMPTAAVFRAMKPDDFGKALVPGCNDLTAAACRVSQPFARFYERAASLAGSGRFWMSGSGSTCVWVGPGEDVGHPFQPLAEMCAIQPFQILEKSAPGEVH